MTVHKNQPNRALLRTGLPVLLLTFVFLGFSHSAFATTCPNPGTMVEWFQESDVVFLGRLTKFDSKSYDLANFRVEKTWKGALEKKIALQRLSRWGDAHQREKRFYVFANKSNSGGYYQHACSMIYEAKLGSWKKRRGDWKFLVLNLLAKGYDEKKFFEEIFKIAKNHKNINYRIQSLELIVRFYSKNWDGYPKGTEKALIELEKTLVPFLENPHLESGIDSYDSLESIWKFKRFGYQGNNCYGCLVLSTPRKEYQYSTAVFLGRPVFIGKTIKTNKHIAVFKVEKAWKGVGEQKPVVAFEYADQFQFGRRYLVYASGSFSSLGASVRGRTKIASNVDFEMNYLDKLAEGMKGKEILNWLLTTAQTHPKKWTRKQAWGMIDAEFNVSVPVLPEGVEEALTKMAGDLNYEHRQYAQKMLDKINLSKENERFLP